MTTAKLYDWVNARQAVVNPDGGRAAFDYAAQGEHIMTFRPIHDQMVRVRPAAEILATLDADYTLDGLPFMPEMLKFCGQRMRVYRRASRTCVEGHGVRTMRDAVLLQDSYCDGAHHDGCQRNCLLFWKEAWLEPVGESERSRAGSDRQLSANVVKAFVDSTRDGERYLCQSSLLLGATKPLRKYNLFKYFREMADGELGVSKFLRIIGRVLLNRVRAVSGIAPIDIVRGPKGPHAKGDLDLYPGERVEIRPVDEIRQTVGPTGRNRGLLFEPDMTPYAGQRFEVDFRIERIISEETGKMVHLTNTVALKNVRCAGLCAKNCPRAQAHFWREAWLKRVEDADVDEQLNRRLY